MVSSIKMKVNDKTIEKKRKIKKKATDKSKKQQVIIVAQEIKFARLLSGNEKKTRDRVLKALKKWLISCFEKNYEFKEDDFTRVWKGLFYAVWMSDKPLVQEDLCESIAGILDLFPSEQLCHAMLLARAGFKMLATEWFGIDQHRIDKFLMLVRRYLRGALRCVHRCSWSEDACNQFAEMLSGKDGVLALKTPLYARNANSMVTHIADCYLEEISKVSSGRIPPDSLAILLRPFLAYLSRGSVPAVSIASRRLLQDLLKHGDTEETDDADSEQGSDEERDAGGNAEENGDVESDEEELTDGALDPRAGRVDVILRPLPVPASQLVDCLRQHLPRASGAGNRRARRCIQLLEQFSSGTHPYAPPSLEVKAKPALKPTKTAKALRALEKKLVANGDELALRGLSRKHRKRLLAKSRAGLSIVDDVEKPETSPGNTANGEWKVEETEQVLKNGKKRKRANKENEAEPKNKRQKTDRQANTETQPKKHKNNVKKQKNDKVNGNVKNNVKAKSSVKENKHNVKDVKSKVKVKGVKQVKNSGKETNDAKVKNSVTSVKSNVKINVKDVKLNKKDTVKTDKKKDLKQEAKLLVNKIKKFQKQDKNTSLNSISTPKKVKFVLKNNSMQGTVDYYKSIQESPNIPFDSSKKPIKTNLKPSTPSPINPFFKKKMTRRASFAAQIVF